MTRPHEGNIKIRELPSLLIAKVQRLVSCDSLKAFKQRNSLS